METLFREMRLLILCFVAVGIMRYQIGDLRDSSLWRILLKILTNDVSQHGTIKIVVFTVTVKIHMLKKIGDVLWDSSSFLPHWICLKI